MEVRIPILIHAISQAISYSYSPHTLSTHRRLACSHVALSEKPNLVLPESPNDRMQHPLVVEQHHIPLLPVMRIYQLRTDPRPLQLMHNLPHGLQIFDDLAASQVDLAHGGRVHLQGELASDGILPDHG